MSENPKLEIVGVRTVSETLNLNRPITRRLASASVGEYARMSREDVWSPSRYFASFGKAMKKKAISKIARGKLAKSVVFNGRKDSSAYLLICFDFLIF